MHLPEIIRHSHKADVLVLVTTFLLTVFADLTIAIGVGTLLGLIVARMRPAHVSV